MTQLAKLIESISDPTVKSQDEGKFNMKLLEMFTLDAGSEGFVEPSLRV